VWYRGPFFLSSNHSYPKILSNQLFPTLVQCSKDIWCSLENPKTPRMTSFVHSSIRHCRLKRRNHSDVASNNVHFSCQGFNTQLMSYRMMPRLTTHEVRVTGWVNRSPVISVSDSQYPMISPVSCATDSINAIGHDVSE
jgi:hypothetical protein